METLTTTRYSVRNILKDNDNWNKYKIFHRESLRPEQIKAVDSMLLCNDPNGGFFYYYCSDCDEQFVRHLSCNSRICSRCGKKYVDKWAKGVAKRMLDVQHNHIVFTMPDSLWNLIKDNWSCVKELSAMTQRVIAETMTKSAKHKIVPGIICSLHTYGKDMKYNVHFHTIVTEGGRSSRTKSWLTVTYLPYELLRFKWKDYVLEVIMKYIKKTEGNLLLIESVCHQYKNGFNVKVIKSKISKRELARYIARYVRHPAISDRRIVYYDGSKVVILCEDKKKRLFVTFTIDEFITRLTWHIPSKNFKLIRYYGLYARNKIGFFIGKKIKQESILTYLRSKHCIKCPSCGKILEPLVYFPCPTGKRPP